MNKRFLRELNRVNGVLNVNMTPRYKIVAWIALVICTFVLAGCGGGGSGSGSKAGSDGAAANLMEGTFVDSPVDGLNYQTATHMGITDSEGHFVCRDGEMISFMIGDVMLGQTMANNIITPMDFLDDSAEPYDITNPMVTNMGRFLQSLDADGNPENGITITEEVRNEISGRMIDFHQSVAAFENDPNVIACFEMMNALDMPHNGMMWGLIPADQARAQMIKDMGAYMDNPMGNGSPESGSGNSGNSMMDGSSGGSMMGDGSGSSMMGGGSGTSMMGDGSGSSMMGGSGSSMMKDGMGSRM